MLGNEKWPRIRLAFKSQEISCEMLQVLKLHLERRATTAKRYFCFGSTGIIQSRMQVHANTPRWDLGTRERAIEAWWIINESQSNWKCSKMKWRNGKRPWMLKHADWGVLTLGVSARSCQCCHQCDSRREQALVQTRHLAAACHAQLGTWDQVRTDTVQSGSPYTPVTPNSFLLPSSERART